MSAEGHYHEQEYSTPSKAATNKLVANPLDAYRLPAPDEEFHLAELGELLQGGKPQAYKFRSNDIIEKVQRVYDGESYRHLWRTKRSVYHWIRDHLDDPDTTPCGNHCGVRCLEAGETYTCLDEDCDCRMDRETAAEVLE